MEFMGSGCLTEVLDQFEVIQMTEEQMAYVALEVPFAFHSTILTKPHPSTLSSRAKLFNTFTAFIVCTATSSQIICFFPTAARSR